MIPEGDGLNVAEKIPVRLMLEDEDIEQAVVEAGIFEKHKRTAVEAAIANKDETAPTDGAIGRNDLDDRRRSGRNLGQREKIAHGAESFFGIGSGLADDLGVEAHSAKLDEIATTSGGKVHLAHMPGGNDLPCAGEIVLRNAEFAGEDIHGADGKDAEADIRPRDAIDHLIDGTIPACGNDGAETLPDPLAGELPGISGEAGGTNDRLRRKRLESLTESAGTFATSGGIKNDQMI